MTAPGAAHTARSWLFAPADSPRKMEKAVAGDADIVIFDLEDAVAPSQKDKARDMAAAFLGDHGDEAHKIWVRINPLDTPYAKDDIAAVIPVGPAGIMLPKPRGADDVATLDREITPLETPGVQTQIIALVTETPQSMLAIGDYSGAPRLAAMTWGAEDLAAALGASDNTGPFDGYDFPYALARSLCLIGAAAAGVPAIETISGDFRDLDALRKRAQMVRRQGFRGMLAIHPAQVAVINDAFTPSDEEVRAAREIVELFAANPGAGTLGHKGAMLDRPHLARAEAILALAAQSARD